MPEEGPCLVPGWAHTSESTLFRADGGPALQPPREYPPHWIRSCSTKRVEDLVIGDAGDRPPVHRWRRLSPMPVNIKRSSTTDLQLMRASVSYTREPLKPESRPSSEPGLDSAVNLAG